MRILEGGEERAYPIILCFESGHAPGTKSRVLDAFLHSVEPCFTDFYVGFYHGMVLPHVVLRCYLLPQERLIRLVLRTLRKRIPNLP